MATAIQSVGTDERTAGQREREIDEAIVASYTRMPEDPPDDWGDPSRQTDARMAEAMRELTTEERAAGFGPWES